ncbi:MAG: hypothetical protein PHR21_04285 [Oscillospiraceae bacterium]|nr:hypothetical protein [Oscillospiraceae bacterium]MDD4368269.1 hypothetical protein [Oscillospiraceae bacterium]
MIQVSQPLPAPQELNAALQQVRGGLRLPADRLPELNAQARELAHTFQADPPATSLRLTGEPRSAGHRLRLSRLLPFIYPYTPAALWPRLDQLMRTYASWTLYEYCWYAFQTCYPHSGLQKALASLHRRLRENIQRYGSPPHSSGLLLPDQVSFYLKEPDLLKAAATWLAGDLQPPQTALSKRWQERYDLIPDAGFSQALLWQLLKQLPDWQLPLYQDLLLNSATPWSDQALGPLLLLLISNAQLSQDDLSRLVRHLTAPLNTPAAYDRIRGRLTRPGRRILDRFLVLDCLRRCYAAKPGKQRVLLDLQAEAETVYELRPDLIIWRFPGFCLLDQLTDPESAYYYRNERLQELSRQGLGWPQLLPPVFPYRQLYPGSDPELADGVVKLQFSGNQLAVTQRFLAAKLRRP